VWRRSGILAWLAASARLFVWPRVDAPALADAIVVLDGDRPRRVARGVALASAGWAPTLVVVRCESSAPELLAEPVPFEVLSFVPVPSTTRGEARAVARLARERAWTRVLVVTSTYHVTRTRIIFRRALPCEARLAAAGFTPARLVRDVPSEWAKLALALLGRRTP
jgi:uncharacterized SAM-binding protein YcdF (DUF218 family)